MTPRPDDPNLLISKCDHDDGRLTDPRICGTPDIWYRPKHHQAMISPPLMSSQSHQKIQ